MCSVGRKTFLNSTCHCCLRWKWNIWNND